MGKRASLAIIAAAATCAMAPLASCLDATEIKLALSTDVPCDVVRGVDGTGGTHVQIRIGSPANIDTNPTTQVESAACTPSDATSSARNDLGTVAIIPSGGFDTSVAISVALSDDKATLSSACFPEVSGGPPSCIYAHRQLSFLPHTLVTLPILLSSKCAGNTTCKAPLTCDPDTGLCTDGHVDPNDCGASCSTGNDAGKPDVIATIDAPSFDGPVFDSPAEAGCPLTETKCNNVCVDLQTNKQNCGGCGLDCSGGTCSSGVCMVNATIVGTCLAVVSGAVYVATSAGVYKVPSSGGAGSLYNSQADQISAMAGTASDVAWIGVSGTSSYLYDLGIGMTYNDTSQTGQVQLMALNATAASWFDATTHTFYYQPLSSTSPPIFYGTINNASNPVWVTMGKQYVYASLPLQNELFYLDGQSTNPIATTNAPGPILSDNPNGTPNVYEVEKGTQVYKRDYKLGNATPFASSKSQITALAWDGQSLFANETNEISVAQGNAFVQLAPATPSPNCIAVDSNAVYWLGANKGLFKVYKP